MRVRTRMASAALLSAVVLVAAAIGGAAIAGAKKPDKQRGSQGVQNESKQRKSLDPVEAAPAPVQPTSPAAPPVTETREAKQRTNRSRANTQKSRDLQDTTTTGSSDSDGSKSATRGSTTTPTTTTPSPAAPSLAAAAAPGAVSNINISGSAQPSGRTPRRGASRRSSGRRRAAQVFGLGAGLTLGRSLLDSAGAASTAGRATGSGSDSSAGNDGSSKSGDGDSSPVARTVNDIVEVVPGPIKTLLAALAILSLVLGGGYLLLAERGRRLARQRSDLLSEVGLLQTALLPPVPATVGAVRTSVAYRPSDGPGAGGDFYDALTLPGGRAAFILGDVSGHGRQALARTAFMRYTLRAYLEAGLEPRMALQVAGRVIDEHLAGDFATVVLAVHDPQSGSLTYACAGHPAPIVVGPSRPEPVLVGSSPPIGLGLRTGLRQTTLPLPAGSVVCLYTDGLAEARTEDNILGRPRLGDIVEGLGRDATAAGLLDEVASEARLVTDDMATVVLTPTAGVTAGGFRHEQIEIDGDEADENLAERFLEACGVEPEPAREAAAEVRELNDSHGGAVVHVRFGMRGPQPLVLPRNVETLELVSRRAISA